MDNLTKLADPMNRVSRLEGPLEKTAALVAPMNTLAKQVDALERTQSNLMWWGVLGLSLWTLATALGAALGVFLGNRMSGKSKPSQSVA